MALKNPCPQPVEYQATTNQCCAFSPWVIGASAPLSGTPLGRHWMTGEPVCCDTLTWFMEGLISNPSAFVLSLPGKGKSTLIRKMFIGAVAQGHTPIVAGDMKGEYVTITRALGGQVIQLGVKGTHLNPLGAGSLGETLPLLEEHRGELEEKGLGYLITETQELVHHRQVTMVCALVELIREAPVEDYEVALVAAALRTLRESKRFSFVNPPLLKDLRDEIARGSQHLAEAVFPAGRETYEQAITPLMRSLFALLDGPLGQVFSGHTTTRLDLSSPALCIDVSKISRGDKKLKAAVMLSCWSDAYGAMEAAHLLAAAGLAPQRYFEAILDELWQVLGAGAGMVNRIDELTRLNRSDGTGLLMITHTGRDLESLPNEMDVKIAKGFIERAGMVICGGLPAGELERLSDVLQFTPAEAQVITSWSAGVPIRAEGAGEAVNQGRGNFMIKVSKDGTPGIPLHTVLTPIEEELRLHDTNQAFDQLAERLATLS